MVGVVVVAVAAFVGGIAFDSQLFRQEIRSPEAVHCKTKKVSTHITE